VIFIEKPALETPIAKRIARRGIPFDLLDDAEDAPDTKSAIVLKAQDADCCRLCPGTRTYRCCGYYTMDVMEGCPFDCAYCVLQAYLPHRNIQVNVGTDSFVRSMLAMIKEGKKRRIGTGELSDSLALDDLLAFSEVIVPIINAQDILQFEFKTKSDRIANLLNLNPKNIVVSWSLNPPEFAEVNEKGAADVEKRLAAAKECAAAGYKIAFHFDPIIYYNGWRDGYGKLLEQIFELVSERAVEYISLSAFRGTGKLLNQMRQRAEIPAFLGSDLVLGLDGKYRYFKGIRRELLSFMFNSIRREWRDVFIYFCMEHSSIWEETTGFDPVSKEALEAMFPFYAV
jgi:spore photoproduct lyase